jgi:hypothetical protein
MHCCDSQLRVTRRSGQTGRALITPAPSEQTHPHQTSRYTPRCPSVVLWTPCSGVEWRVFEPTIRVWRSGTTGKQPANLAVEGAEESLTILPDYTPTVRPRPSAVDHLDRDMLNPTSDLLSHCHRRVCGVH